MINKIRKWGIHFFILLLPLGIFYWQAPFLGNRVIGNDYGAFPIQHQMELQYSLKHGTFPLYVPGFSGGHSAAALTLGQLYHPISHLASVMPGYWQGDALQWNTLLRLLSLGLIHLGLFLLLVRLGLNRTLSFIISFITVYNMRMLDLFRYGASLENYTGYLFLCLAAAFYYIKPTRFLGPVSIVAATYLLVCGGHPQMMYLGLLGAGIAVLAIPFVLTKISREIKTDRLHLVKYFKTIAVCILVGILLSSAYTLPFYFDFLSTNSQRAGQDYQWALKYTIPFGWMISSFFAPLKSEVHSAFGSSPLILLIALIPLLYAFRIKVPIAVTALWAALTVIFLCGLGDETPLHYYFWKYFPLADSFRIPGRITMLFPFLFLLLLAWLFRQKNEKIKPGSKPFPFSPYVFPALAAIVLFFLYNRVWITYLPNPRFYVPMHIDAYPPGVDSLIFWLGLATLFLVILYSFYFKKYLNKWRTAIGILLAIAVMVQVTAEFRYGTWVIKKRPQPTLTKMDRQKKSKLIYRGAPGFGLESSAVSIQKEQSVLEPWPAKFYRKYKEVSNRNRAYRFLNKENVTETVVIETKTETEPGQAAPFKEKNNSNDLKRDDRILLKEGTFNRVLFSVDAGAPGFFAFSFPYSPNWQAIVDGKSARVFRANGYMQGVYLEAGSHEIEFRWWSKAAFAGMLISCLTFLLMGGYFAFFVFKGKQRIIVMTVALSVPVSLFFAWHASLYSGDNLGTRYTWTSKDFPPVNNLAYAKKNAMSSRQNVYYSGFGVDGKDGESFRTDKNKKGWWQVDLGSPKEIGEIVVYDKHFRGGKHLPLQILGSIDGNSFKPLRSVLERGSGNPWRIPMNGEITRFVKLQSPAKESLAFSEIEIYPPPPSTGVKKENPLVHLVQREPITGEILKKITLLKQAVKKGDKNKVRLLLEKEKNASKEIETILIFTALNALETGNREILDILLRYEAGGISKHKAFNLWNPSTKNKEEISPFLHIQGKRGRFTFDFKREKNRNVLVVSNIEPNKDGKRICQFGYSAGQKGFNLEIAGGSYIHFMVKAKIPAHLINKDNYLFIQDFSGQWEREKFYFSGPGWLTYLVSKKIRPGSTKLSLGIYFTPQSGNDRIMLDDINVFISDRRF